ncbi:SDR family NAD(P)-dependent oxidoreductase [Nocardia sp. SYP-A9097]|uniref:SDR family oxidoreductase n=1 Tax=Nocardia sp. SYP-A9097 TaxID=2663237 RepID=UPI00129A5028|nr:SDR family oxidoreductase [Nocardia sp. SYP-A9097]MRH92971.1 SDR family NAD(P)-dependent oxidoreductase [Nocardia sp. SYP-A9097]
MTTALITGANKGIGFETARQLAARGMTVLMAARDKDLGQAAADTLKAEGAQAHFVHLDVTDEDSIARAAEWIDSEFGSLDILINNAAITGGLDGDGKPSSTALATLRRVYETNVFGVVAVTNAMLPLLRRAEAARIVNVSSEVSSLEIVMNPDGHMWQLVGLPYPSSKTALNMVTAMYAKELWNTPIKINAANPGYCATDLNHNSGFRTPAEGAEPSVHLATLPQDGPSGELWGYQWDSAGGYGRLPW